MFIHPNIVNLHCSWKNGIINWSAPIAAKCQIEDQEIRLIVRPPRVRGVFTVFAFSCFIEQLIINKEFYVFLASILFHTNEKNQKRQVPYQNACIDYFLKSCTCRNA